MGIATRNEIEYLGSLGGKAEDASLIRELSRRLDALRRYDQHFCGADWHPRRPNGARIASQTFGLNRAKHTSKAKI